MKKFRPIISFSIWSRLLVLAGLGLMSSCQKDPIPPTVSTFNQGFWVVNEGPFGSGTGTLTWVARDGSRTEQDVFGRVNQRPLGNIAQNMLIHGGIGMVVLNNAGRLEWVNPTTMQSLGSLSGFELPSAVAMDPIRSKAYVSEWVRFGGAGRVAVVDWGSRQVLKRIPVGPFPDALVVSGNRLVVANGDSNTVTLVDTESDTVVQTLTVGDRPNSLVVLGPHVIVLCGGQPAWRGSETPGSLHWIRLSDGLLMGQATWGRNDDHPKDLLLTPDGDALLYQLESPERPGIHRISLPLGPLNIIQPTQPWINRLFYHTAYDPYGSRYLVTTDAADFASAGKIFRWNQQGALVDSFTAGIAPGHVVFVP
jgi:YVTN family beta-propeller protein